MSKPSIFVGSSTEGLPVAQAVQFQLRNDGDVQLWNEDVFGLGHSILESLIKALNTFDFAVFVLTADDLTVSRGEQQACARDNVLIELGLFIGRITQDRTFLLVCKDKNIRIPSDLAGIMFTTFSMPTGQGTLTTAVAPACYLIRNSINKQGPAHELKRIAEEVRTQKEAVQKQGEIIGLIYEALRRTLTKYEYQHLAELESSDSLPCKYTISLQDEMKRLCYYCYIEETYPGAVWAMQGKGDTTFDLREFFRIRDEGKDHLRLLRRLKALTADERPQDEV